MRRADRWRAVTERAARRSGRQPAPAAAAPIRPIRPRLAIDCPNCGLSNDSANLFCEQCGYDFTTGQAPPSLVRPRTPAEPAAVTRFDREVGRRRRGRSCVVRVEGIAGRPAVPAGVVVDGRAHSTHGADRSIQPVARHPSGDRPRLRHRRLTPARPTGPRRRRAVGDGSVVDQRHLSWCRRVSNPTDDTEPIEAGRPDAAARRRPRLRRRVEPAHRSPRLSVYKRRVDVARRSAVITSRLEPQDS